MPKKTSSQSLADKLFPITTDLEDIDVVDIPPEKRRLHTETYDFSVATIHEYLKNGNIYLPEFQRGYVWNRSQASRLIESLIIQCPIPVIYFNQDPDERLAVIDGNQRLQSIRLFLEDEFALHGLTAYPELENQRFSELDYRLRRHIQNRTLRCIAILKETHPQIKFDVFERINTGAVQLNPQEIRHGIFYGDLLKLVDQLALEPEWKRLSGIRNDTRMKGSELILRFLALYKDRDGYTKPLSGFLNQFCEENKSIDSNTLLKWRDVFITALTNIDTLFGDAAFRIIDINLKPSVRNLNAALFDAQMVAIALLNPGRGTLQNINKRQFMRAFYELLQDKEFAETIESGTSGKQSVQNRIERVYQFFKEQLG